MEKSNNGSKGSKAVKKFNEVQSQKQACFLSCILMMPEYAWRQPVLVNGLPTFVDLAYLQSQVKPFQLTVPKADCSSFWNIEKWARDSVKQMVARRGVSFLELRTFINVFHKKININVDETTAAGLNEMANAHLSRVVAKGHLEQFIQIASVMRDLGVKLRLCEKTEVLFRFFARKAVNFFTNKNDLLGVKNILNLADWLGVAVCSKYFSKYCDKRLQSLASLNHGQISVFATSGSNTPNGVYKAAIDFIMGR